MPQSCYYRLGCFGPRAFFFAYQSRYEAATCTNIGAALFEFFFVSCATSKHVTGAREIILAQVLTVRSKNEHYEACDVLCDIVYPQGCFFINSVGGHPIPPPPHQSFHQYTSSFLSILHPAHTVIVCLFFFLSLSIFRC